MTFEDLPTTLKIGPWAYQIIRWDQKECLRENLLGQADHTLFLIKVDVGWGWKKTAATLLHEIVHCAFTHWEIHEGDVLERMVSTLERALAAIWHDNPEMFAWIAEGLTQ